MSSNENFIKELKEARKNLHYMSAVSKTPPGERVPVNSCKMEALDRSIREKVKQNRLRSVNPQLDDHIYGNS